MRLEKPKNSRRWSSRIIEMLIVMVAIGLTINFFATDTADTTPSHTYIEPVVVIPANDQIEAEALFDEAMTLMGNADYEGALALVNMAIELDDAPPRRYFWKQAWLLGQVRQHQAAIDVYLNLQATGENPAYALGGLCFNYGSLSNFVEATHYCEAAGDYDSHSQYSQDSMCYIHGFTGQYELAVEECTNWLTYESHAYAYNNRSHAYLMLEDYQNAIADATQAILLQTDRPEMPYTNRGLAKIALGQYSEGYADLMVAYGADNTYPDIYLGLGMYHDKMDDEYLARENYCAYVGMAWVTPAESVTERIAELGGCS
jgi:tetratricopeptide (TPR) repeat protein